MTAMAATAPLEVIWHDVECGGYANDLALWAELSDSRSGPILEIGCGTGRVALCLAACGHRVTGLDNEPALTAAMRERAAGRGIAGLAALDHDARMFATEGRFGLILMPMQVLQLFTDAGERRQVLETAREHLVPGGLIAAAIIEGVPLEGQVGTEYEPALPDVAEVDGWVYSSLPLEVASDGDRMVVTRLRQSVSPAGDLSEHVDRTSLARLTSAQVADETGEAGLEIVGRCLVEDSSDHVGSTVILMGAT